MFFKTRSTERENTLILLFKEDPTTAITQPTGLTEAHTTTRFLLPTAVTLKEVTAMKTQSTEARTVTKLQSATVKLSATIEVRAAKGAKVSSTRNMTMDMRSVVSTLQACHRVNKSGMNIQLEPFANNQATATGIGTRT